jgi:hypothetical protein
MKIDWPLLVSIVIPIITLLLGAAINRVLERRVKLITYVGHTSVFTVQPNPPAIEYIHTHAIVIRNAGRLPAHNVRIGHHVLPNFYIHPPIPHTIEDVPKNGKDILIPILVPGEQITVSYLYAPPLIWNQVNSQTKSDEGFAKTINVLPTTQYSRSVGILAFFLWIMGVVAIIYILIWLLVRFTHGS